MNSLKGITLRVGILEGTDYAFDCGGGTRPRPAESYSLHVLGLLQDVLGFGVEFVAAASWGHPEEGNGTRTGLAALLANNLTDLNICHWPIDDRLSAFSEFLTPTLETTESLVYIPENLPLTQDVFVQTFSHKLWIFFTASIFLIVVFFRFSTSMHSDVRPDHEPWSWNEVLLWATAAVAQQSFSRHPRGSSCRTMFLIGYSIAYLLYTGFAAGITSLLALQDHHNRLSLDDVDAAGWRLTLLADRDEYPFDFAQKPNYKYFHRFQHKERRNLSQIFSGIRSQNIVGFGSTVTFLNYLEQEGDEKKRKRVVIAPISRSAVRKAFLVGKSFLFKNLFNYWLIRLTETGLLDFGVKRFFKTDGSAVDKQTLWSSASFGNVASAFLFLSGGWILSAFVLIAEIVAEKRNPKRKRLRDKPRAIR